VRIFERTVATAVDATGLRKRVQTRNGLVRAHHVVLAGNVQAGSADAEIGATVLPVRAPAAWNASSCRAR
jgi:glycine/D-amino acid oxidase-like deaminating enzyme